jgi:alcohol dehydrogenase (cytochrome c)
LLFWGVGNPKPDYDAGDREGDNLYSNSVIALNGSTGELEWYFQFTPADDKDWDANQMPVLADRAIEGRDRKLLLWANRNGFYYVLDRITGEYLTGTPFVEQNWAKGLDSKGRPIVAQVDRGLNGELLYPGNVGGTNWWPPTYDEERGLMIVPTLEQGMVYFPSLASPPRASGRSFYTAVRALDATTGRLVWERRHEPRFTENGTGGLLSTAGGLVFGGDRGTFFALDASDGRRLWSAETGSRINAAPMTYAVNGEQFVAIAAGGVLVAFRLPRSLQAAVALR